MRALREIAFLGMLALAALVSMPATGGRAEDEEPKGPAGRLTARMYILGLGVGIFSGSGTLEFRGQRYPFSLSGFGAVDLGVAAVTATGSVYELTDVADFAGTYIGYDAGEAAGTGMGAGMFKNEHGVVVDLTTDEEGARLRAGVVSIRVKLNIEPKPLRMEKPQ